MNSKIKCLIVDDERNSREVLKKLLDEYTEEVEFIGEAADAEGAFKLINDLNPELVFLDIQMPGGDGFSLLNKFQEINFEIIFVTSFDQYAINAIRFNALDYLLKPIETKELTDAIARLVEKTRNRKRENKKIEALLHNLKNTNKRITVHVGDKVKLIEESDILYIEADGRYSNIYTADDEKYTTPRNLKDFEDNFGDQTSFIRISKTYMVNATYIKEYSKGEPFVIKMNTGTTFEVARRKKAEVLEKLKG